MRAHQAQYPMATMARVLGVSTSGFYSWRDREPSASDLANEELLERIVFFYERSDRTYGAPRIYRDLVLEDERNVSINRVARLMRIAGLQGVTRRKLPITTVRVESERPAPDLVERRFVATAPDQLWVADITYVPTLVGFFYLAIVLDVFSRRVVGWAMENHLLTPLVLAALDMAIERRRPKAVIHHSDQGCQYTSVAFGKRCEDAGVMPSMGSVGDCYDNAMAESFFATLECELIDRYKFTDRPDGMRRVFKFIEGWYNPTRRHSSIHYLSPMEYERRFRLKA